MGLLNQTNRRLVELQKAKRFRVAFVIVAVLAASGYFLPAVIESYQFNSIGQSVFQVLREADLSKGETAAVQFVEEGTVTIAGVTYGDPRLTGIAPSFFDESGRCIAPVDATTILISSMRPEWIPGFVLESPGLGVALWLGAVCWLALVGVFGLGWNFLLLSLASFLLTIPFWVRSAVSDAITAPPDFETIFAIVGISFLAMTFALLTRLALVLLSAPHPVFAIAQSVVREAVRQRVSVVFVIVLVVILPLIPSFIDDAEPLRYQIQSYLSRSISLTYVILACMSVVLGCSTVAFEIRDRQIWQVMTKPVHRFKYLVGKWLGIMAISGVGLFTASTAIFISVEVLKTRPALDELDDLAVRTEVLTARAGKVADYERIPPSQLREIVDGQIDADVELSQRIDRGETTLIRARADLVREVTKEFDADQRKIPPGASKILTFSGLPRPDARDGKELRLRYLFHCGSSDTHEVHPVIVRFPRDQTWIDLQYVPTVGAFLSVPAELVSEEGTLEVELINSGFNADSNTFFPAEYSLFWDKDKLEVLYHVSDFEINFLRAVLVDWFKLAFLGVLAVSTACFLSFPVACLLSFAIFIGGSIGPYLGISLTQYYPTNFAEQVVAAIAFLVHTLLNRFGEIQPAQMLVEGRVIPWSEVWLEFFWLVVVWALISLLVGFTAFSRKELAIYSGQG